MKQKDIAQLSAEELKKTLTETRIALTKMKLNHAVANMEAPHKIRETRRAVARMITETKNRNSTAQL
ncbi:MAG: 50S ribosomal protein L29 [Bacteroidota bacterium]|nr:50S ribosomal protein L29 [Bacteroidota bacterium]